MGNYGSAADVPLVLLVGWKNIRKALGDVSYGVAIKYMRNYGLPVLYLNRHPTITRTAIDEWWRSLGEQAALDKTGTVGRQPSEIADKCLKGSYAKKGDVRNPDGGRGSERTRRRRREQEEQDLIYRRRR